MSRRRRWLRRDSQAAARNSPSTAPSRLTSASRTSRQSDGVRSGGRGGKCQRLLEALVGERCQDQLGQDAAPRETRVLGLEVAEAEQPLQALELQLVLALNVLQD